MCGHWTTGVLIELTKKRHIIGKIKTENARFHAIIQVDISIRSFDQNNLSVYFSGEL